MNTPRALFSHGFLQICLFVLSLYTVGRLVILPCEISVQAPVICVKMAGGRYLGFDPTGNGAIRSTVPENPTLEPNMKGIGRSVAELFIGPFEIFQNV